jgi:uncharacterized tellurite resistance protein B-like protein
MHMLNTSERLLEGHTDEEKAAYLSAIASLATADREASEEELTHIQELCREADLSPQQMNYVMDAARDVSGTELRRSLDVLKRSDLRFSLITDLIALAEADDEYTDEERRNIEQMANYLNVDQKQRSLLDQFVHRAAEQHSGTDTSPTPSVNSLADGMGMRQDFSNAGLNMGSLGKGIFGMLGPMILGGIASKALGRRRGGMGGGMLGGMMGGGLGSVLGGMVGGGGGMRGGLGSILSGLSRSRNNRSMGGLLSRIL